MKTLRKPPALQKGDRIAVMAPASPVERNRLQRGVRTLERAGYCAVFGDQALARCGLFAGEHGERAGELLALLENPSVKAVFCARGGYGSNYIVERLASPATLRRLKRQPPKIVLGYSDVTSLLVFLNQALGWVTFHGPMVSMEFARGQAACDLGVLQRVLSRSAGFTLKTDARTLRPGVAEGRLAGGCLSILAATLGTPQAIDTRGTILLLEDVGEKPYRVDRMLFQLRRAGKFRGVKAVVFGQMPGCDQKSIRAAPARERSLLHDVILESLAGLKIPVVFGLRFGHTTGKALTLPLGVRARLSAGSTVRLTLLEPAVLPAEGTARRRNR